ncbi:MAG: hypothetical protein NW241_03745 [Bacteroidia bacterium]|nr:hypothetical protein [Bacteroidia bacterium]
MPPVRRHHENPLLFPQVSLPAGAGYGELAADPFLLQMVYADQLGERIAMLEGEVLKAVACAIGRVTGVPNAAPEPVPAARR